jgi:nondiscriminating glutamyl-tRNA synthetase
MTKSSIRVRFAPSPTGMMHLGNVRTALMNYLFALQKKGTFIIRIEDTDFERNMDPGAQQILADLAWLGLQYQEGPLVGGSHEPYFQSQRTALYQKKLHECEQKNLIYRCFCSPEELEKKRQRQLALKQPPRYDRACLKLSPEEIHDLMAHHKPYIWRFKLNQEEPVIIHDLGHGSITFDLKSFSDIPLTRQDGTFTFMFANFIDDVTMEITHVIRGEDHLSNTAGQVAMYQAWGVTPPVFWHLPILCNAEGKKLSKRDFGFSLNDLRTAGFLPEAIDNYLAIIGGSFEQEIMSRAELAQTLNFEHINPTSQIKYDVEKLRWLNHAWIARCGDVRLEQLCRPYLEQAYPQANMLNAAVIIKLLDLIRTDLKTLADCVPALKFYFKAPMLDKNTLISGAGKEFEGIRSLIKEQISSLATPELFMKELKKACQENNLQTKTLFLVLRMALTGTAHGPSIHDLITMLGTQEAKKRLHVLFDL